jgi:Uncharacterized protein conserved in bacteria (DUF2141)
LWSRYSLGFRTSTIKAWNDAASTKDSVVVIRFQTSDPRDYGAVSGTLVDSALIVPTTATMRLNASNDGTLTTIASIRTTGANTRTTSSIAETRAMFTTNGQYILVLEAALNLALQEQLVQNTPKASSNQVPSPFAQRRFERIIKKTGAWDFADIPPGTYIISVFYDANGNGKYDYGTVFPYLGAERFHAHPSEIQVRARWTIENVEVQLP